MIFSDLTALPYDRRSGIIDLAALRRALPETPEPVAQQFYADHGRKDEFQNVYRGLRIDHLAWRLVSRTATDLVSASMNPDFRRWFDAVSERAAGVAVDGWRVIDGRKAIVAHWEQHRTWILPPVLLDGALMLASPALHLVEGHTRVGLLSGLLRSGILPGTSLHSIWCGSLSL